jgi:hypothetical protein
VNKKNKHEKRMLVECAQEGFRLLDAHFRCNAAGRFASAPFIPAPEGLAEKFEDRLYAGNPDLFYAGLSVLHATQDKHLVNETIKRKEAKVDLECSLDFIQRTLHRESQFELELAESICRHTQLGDAEIRKEFSARFNVSPLSLMSLPTDRNIYFAKVNHGYWEYMRSAYDDAHAGREQFREINVRSKIRRLRTSGVTQAWGWQIHRHLMQAASTHKHVSLSVSLTAGTEPPAQSIMNELTPVTRGAAIGLMSMFDAALPELDHYRLGDGGATRSLIFDKTLEPFFERYIVDSEACVLVAPPHLKQVDFVDYKGAVYKFVVPATTINETWKTVAATLLGYLMRLGKQHRSITVLGQGASVISLMALLFADVDALQGIRLRYIDLGRVLDVAAPDFLQKQPWAMKNLDEYVVEGKKVFRNSSVDAGLVLASAI